MLIKKLEKKVAGAPIKVGKSKGGIGAYMVGTCYVTFKGQKYERPVVFLDQNLNPEIIPGLDQLMTIDQLIKFSQPKAWEFDVGAIAQVEQQLKEALPSSDATAGQSIVESGGSSASESGEPNPGKPEERPVVR